MYRVVTKSTPRARDQQRICVDTGPWHADEKCALKWAGFLRETGYYYAVYVESSKRDKTGTVAP